ncbi:Esterase FE4 [Camponotus floridanus]|uniref:Esterase FE4 n=1 Tax=Camponotus floridanus TaxID=104421 RepID=E2ANU0_CAMFO|nr:Esterase FE4 [Camponotus floridanus]
MISAKDSTLLNTMFIRLLIVLLCLNLTILANSEEIAPKVKTLSGALKGYYKISQYGRKYEAYEGIPYALPPIGELRFKPPRPITPWISELSATKFGSPCIQYDQFASDSADKVEGAEDCLYLNIYVPVRNKTENKTSMPVLFWIHGGAFQYGSGMIYGATYLMDSEVILVAFNYRLGPMGMY